MIRRLLHEIARITTIRAKDMNKLNRERIEILLSEISDRKVGIVSARLKLFKISIRSLCINICIAITKCCMGWIDIINTLY